MSMDRATSIQLEQRTRVGMISVVFLLLFLTVFGRLVQRQVFEYPHWAAVAREQHTISKLVPAQRGKIFVDERDDESLYPLATNVTLFDLMIVPNQIRQPELVVSKLMPYLRNVEESELILQAMSDKLYIPPLKRKLSEPEATEISELGLSGVYLVPEGYRYFPEETMAAQVLGFVNRDDIGQYGLEGYFNEELGGKSGFLEAELDTFGQQIALGKRSAVDPEDGLDLVVTIDRALQYYVERELKKSVEQHEAEKGSVIIMDPKTGKIVVMAQYPTFDPNNYNQESIDLFTNMNISQVYEPGSVFKTLTMASALDAGLVSPSTTYMDVGFVDVNDITIRNSDLKANGIQNMSQVLEKSLNTGMVFVVQKLGKNLFNKYLDKFGFFSTTGVELDGEVALSVKGIRDWSDVDLATMAYGQGIAVTPMQLVAAVGAIANDGRRMQPHIIDRILYPSGAVSIDPVVVEQAISPQAAQLTTAMMVNVIEKGHASAAFVPGYHLAGKTGTAQMVNSQTGTYYDEAWGTTIHNFIGFGPVEDPQFVMLTRLDKPKDVLYAASSAAPLFGNIAKYLLDYWRVPPTY